MSKKKITVYTDGACSGNPGAGGYGVILMYGGHKKEISSGYTLTTNNRMELMGVIAALAQLSEPCEIDLYTDSQYVVNSVEKGWVFSWQKNGWRKADKKPAQNSDLWEMFLSLYAVHTVRFHWVKGHAENELNNRCDTLAVEASKAPKFEDLGFDRKE